ncbi:sulfatase-like hydrolase/transferase, partial [Haloferula sp.]|uniref:sulfatase-like hydrolase/transferase n=1 Tax=Haloferula sp. TaxID=2497595 RepID=UPI003C760D77
MAERPMRRGIEGGWRIAGGVCLFLAVQYFSAIWRLTTRTDGMDSKFSQVAVDDYRGFLISQNLMVVLAYAIVGLVAWLVLVPALSRLSVRWSGHRPWKLVVASALGCALIHGYFMFRLVDSRPYFTGDAAFGTWYYAILDLPPESWRPAIHLALFQLPIWMMVAGVLIWWWRRFAKLGRMVTSGLAVVTAVALVIAMVPHAGPMKAASQETDRPMNVLIIGSDSLRGDKLGYAGYRPLRKDGPAAEGVSPNIDRWAKDASIFEVCRTSIGSTFESGISVMTSTYPHTHGIRQMFPTKEELDEMRKRTTPIAELAREKGYQTAAVGDWCAGFFQLTPLGFEKVSVSSFDNFQIYMSQVVLMAHFVVPLYFDNDLGYRLFPQIRSFAQFVTPEVVTRRVEGMIEEQASSEQPFFWNVFYSCNHLPYRSGEPYNQMFSDPDYKGPNATGVDFDIDGFIGGTDLEDKWAALPREEAQQIRALY